MRQVTIYLNNKMDKIVTAAAKSIHLSKSKWISELIKTKAPNEWPESIAALAGTWEDMPLAEESRASHGKDVKREKL
jgi:hypothetical protein